MLVGQQLNSSQMYRHDACAAEHVCAGSFAGHIVHVAQYSVPAEAVCEVRHEVVEGWLLLGAG